MVARSRSRSATLAETAGTELAGRRVATLRSVGRHHAGSSRPSPRAPYLRELFELTAAEHGVTGVVVPPRGDRRRGRRPRTAGQGVPDGAAPAGQGRRATIFAVGGGHRAAAGGRWPATAT
ncbi:hypothetical protein [Nonomuraea rubra]|uniref:hypothetical protein n=1 Tax=Nonomuraea rubra TaxID=46180 RepID=UPI0031EF3B3B